MLRCKLGRQETTSEKSMLKQRHEGKLGKKVLFYNFSPVTNGSNYWFKMSLIITDCTSMTSMTGLVDNQLNILILTKSRRTTSNMTPVAD